MKSLIFCEYIWIETDKHTKPSLRRVLTYKHHDNIIRTTLFKTLFCWKMMHYYERQSGRHTLKIFSWFRLKFLGVLLWRIWMHLRTVAKPFLDTCTTYVTDAHRYGCESLNGIRSWMYVECELVILLNILLLTN